MGRDDAGRNRSRPLRTDHRGGCAPILLGRLGWNRLFDVILEDNELATYDLNEDCRLNLADFAFVASQWVVCQRIPEDACDW